MGNGMAQHQRVAETTIEWLTPPYIIKALGEFDLDPCFGEPRPWDTAKEHYGEFGLMRPWRNRIWLNPPYGLIAVPWMQRLADHGHGTALIFARTESAMFHEEVFKRANGLFFLRKRLYFHYPDGRQSDNNGGSPSVLIAYGESDSEILKNCGLDGYYVKLR